MLRSWGRPRRRRVLAGVTGVAAAAALVVLPVTTASAVGDYGPDTCLEGYVWRQTVDADHVCVTPATRNQVIADNAAAAQRRTAFGCLPGYVYRGAMATGMADYRAAVAAAYAAGQDPTVAVQAHMNALAAQDHVCVSRGVRNQTAADNTITTWAARVLQMQVTITSYSTPVVVQGSGFNSGTAYVAVVRSSDNTVLWQATVATTAAASFTIGTPFGNCGAPGTPYTTVYIVAYDYAAGVWRIPQPSTQVC